MSGLPYLYTPYYCEENIWQLCLHPDVSGKEKRVVFISNRRRSCALAFQRAAADQSQFVFWDYHVILLCEGMSGSWEVWDLDTLLGMPLHAHEYLSRTFVTHNAFADYMPCFKVVDPDYYLEAFSSDRSHMRTASGGWSQPPPPWPPIQKSSATNLMNFVDMDDGTTGNVMDLPSFVAEFASSRG